MRLSEAKSLRVGQVVYLKEHWDASGQPSKARVSGVVHTWVTQPDRVQVPVKRGLRDSGYITEKNLDQFTLRAPTAKKKGTKGVTHRRTVAASPWITDPHGPWRTREGAERFVSSQDHKYSDCRVHQSSNGLFYFQWKPKGMR